MSLLNLSRKVLFSFFPDAKALFGWTMPDPTALRPLRWRPSSGPCRGFWPCASAEYLPKRHHVSRDTTDAHSSYCIKLHQIVSNCREQHESTWINMNQKTPLAFVVLGSRSRSDGILEGGMPCCESCNGCLFLVVAHLPVDVVKSPPYHW